MPLEFSFVGLFNLVMVLATILVLWKALSPLGRKLVMIIRDPETEVTDPISEVRWGWLVFGVLLFIFLIFNPVDFSISEQAERQKQRDMKVTREFKKDIPPRVEVEERSLDKALEKFDDVVDSAREENAAEQQLNPNESN